MIIPRNVSLFYSNLVHFRLISGVITSDFSQKQNKTKQNYGRRLRIGFKQKLIRVETCNGPLCVGKQASEYSIC